MSKFSRSVKYGLIVLAISIRVAAVLVLRSHEVPRSTYEHGEIAANLVAGRGFSMRFLGADGPTAQQAPVYPLLVALSYRIGGVEMPRSLLILELGQAVLGGLLVMGVLRLSRLVAPGRPRLAATAGLIVAVHPTLVYASTHVQVAPLATTLLVWTLAWGYQAGATGRPRDAAIAGGWLAVLTLTDPILSLAMIGIAWAIWLGRRELPESVSKNRFEPRMGRDHKARGGNPGNTRESRFPGLATRAVQSRPSGAFRMASESLAQSIRLTTVVAITAIAGVSPWLLRNALVFGEFVAIKSTFGYAFWQGNCALSQGTDKVVRRSVESILDQGRDSSSLEGLNRTLWEARHEAGYLDDIALTREDYRRLGWVSEPERSRILFRRALADLRADPARYGQLCLRRLRYFILFDETNPKTRVWAYRLPHLGLTVLAGLGLFLADPTLRKRLAPTLVTAAGIIVFHSFTIVSARFHIPIEPLMGLWGTGAASWLAARVPTFRAEEPETGGLMVPNW